MTTPNPVPKRPGTLQSLREAFTSWRTASVTLMSFASGMPLGLIWVAIPDWMRKSGVDIRVVGLFTLAQAPWTFKFLWSPLMDRYVPPLGRRRGWAAIAQIALFFGALALAGLGNHPDTPWVVGAIALAMAFAGATQDIAVDAYAVDVLRPDEQAVAAGARNALWRLGYQLAGSISIWLAGLWGWQAVNVMLACLYLPMLVVLWKAPDPQDAAIAPRTLKEAVWYPFLGFLSRHRALEILAFVLLYKLADNLVQALQRPFLIDKGYSDFDRGFVLFVIGLVVNVVGTFIGGLLTTPLGLGRALWVFGFIQIFANAGYAILAHQPGPNRPMMWAAFGFETLASSLASGAFLVLLMRMTQKRFSATQYALFSSLFGLPRIVSGPICGFLVHAIGWEAFFWATLPTGIPGLILLARFVPFTAREPEFRVEPPRIREPLTRGSLALRGLAGALVGLVFGAFTVALMSALEAAKKGGGFDLLTPLAALVHPENNAGWLTLLGLVIFGAVCGLLTAAIVAARHGAGQELALEDRPDVG
ncbi:MAG: transporter, family, beta-lactamase induction signal transducer AmpG [Acidobacteriota bacterium]|nr:transporter, family, beta-lactamase induction signal transducer AmpG [Acidobacteriota bacterium]